MAANDIELGGNGGVDEPATTGGADGVVNYLWLIITFLPFAILRFMRRNPFAWLIILIPLALLFYHVLTSYQLSSLESSSL